ncbi:hypothetical protein GOACH_04_05250 [Gordonia aichiensis NBRC 108223]|uniref:Uncharacterized protein n=1 Tax=Gordonia aichiensis NBRC 108223 TaxID=1220583 RepID=L7KGX2_9ACTN|nr:hypothetical protein GOACH_04_05250 [Gordonia aichiensis NBRC 108223]
MTGYNLSFKSRRIRCDDTHILHEVGRTATHGVKRRAESSVERQNPASSQGLHAPAERAEVLA